MGKWNIVAILVVMGLLAGWFGCAAPAPAPTPTPTAKPAPTPAPAPTPTPAPKPKTVELRIGAGSVGTTNYIQKTAIKVVVEKYNPNIKITIVPYASITFAANAFVAKEIDIAGMYPYQFSKPDLKADWNKDARFLWGWPGANLDMFVLDKSSIKTFADVKGKRIGTGPKQGMGEICLVYLMDEMGWKAGTDYTIVSNEYGDYGKVLREGTVDAIYGCFSYVGAYMTDLGSTSKFRRIDDPQPQTNNSLVKAWGEGTFIETVVKKGDWANIDRGYVGPLPYKSYENTVWWTVWNGLDTDIAYSLVKTMWDHVDEAAAISAIFKYIEVPKYFTLPQQQRPFHAGALKYYKERGWIK